MAEASKNTPTLWSMAHSLVAGTVWDDPFANSLAKAPSPTYIHTYIHTYEYHTPP